MQLRRAHVAGPGLFRAGALSRQSVQHVAMIEQNIVAINQLRGHDFAQSDQIMLWVTYDQSGAV